MMYMPRKARPIGDDWRSIDAAPRDGTVIEVCCTYGVAPWYDLYRWTDEAILPHVETSEGVSVESLRPHKFGKPRWYSATKPGQGVSDEAHLFWRPTTQDPETYIDPTQGFQDTNAYWLQACGFPTKPSDFERFGAASASDAATDEKRSGTPTLTILVAIGLGSALYLIAILVVIGFLT